MSRMVLLLLLVGVGLAVALLIVSVFSRGNATSDGALTRANSTGVQKTAYAMLLAVLFGIASGVLNDM